MEDYVEKLEKNPDAGLLWNIPEQKQGIINVIGGNAQNFRASVKTAEFLAANYPLKAVNLVLPEGLRSKLPPLENLIFLPDTEAGSFAEVEGLRVAIKSADFSLFIGDFSKNAVTGKVITEVLQGKDENNGSASVSSATSVNSGANRGGQILITRDTVDLLAENGPEKALLNENLVIFASMPQLQKLFKAAYYPKMLLMSQSIFQVTEALHKFTLSYLVKLITLHNGQIVMAEKGKIRLIPLNNTDFSALTLWGGEAAGKIAALNLYNPNNFLKATTVALFATE